MTLVHFKSSEEFLQKALRIFNDHKQLLLTILPNADIQHIGATSIKNSISKGDLDINVRVDKQNFEQAKEKLKNIYHENQPENWTENFASFKDDSFSLPLGIQLTVKNSEYDNFVKFRDLLNSVTHLLEEYNKMKLSSNGKDINDYRKAKSRFFERLKL